MWLWEWLTEGGGGQECKKGGVQGTERPGYGKEFGVYTVYVDSPGDMTGSSRGLKSMKNER